MTDPPTVPTRSNIAVLLVVVCLLGGCHTMLPFSPPRGDAPADHGAADIQSEYRAESSVDRGGFDALVERVTFDGRGKDASVDRRLSIDAVASDIGKVDGKGQCVIPPFALCTGAWCQIPAGCFMMGAAPSDPCGGAPNEDRHQVTLTHGFTMTATEVTQSEYLSLIGTNPSSNTKCGPSCPVESVTWHQAASYCNALSTTQALTPCYSCNPVSGMMNCVTAPAFVGKAIYTCPGYRLPTEAEFEYAERAGSASSLYNGQDLTDCFAPKNPQADPIGWCFGNSGSPSSLQLAKTKPNPWGLYGLAGNAFEWVHDGYTDHLGTVPVIDPVTDTTLTNRVVRGGSYLDYCYYLRSPVRAYHPPAALGPTTGFRCVRSGP